MSVIGAVNSGNDPFIGGNITRTGQANVAGGIPSANTSVGNPIGGVNPGTPFFARNNQGSNIGIPYTRLCPLGSKDGAGLGRPPRPALPVGSVVGTPDPEDTSEPIVVKETEDLRATKIGFILGKRSQGIGEQTTMVNAAGDVVYSGLDPFAFGYSYGVNAGIAPGMPGTERFQKLCSLEYLQRYFTNVLYGKAICLQNDGTAGGEGAEFGTNFARTDEFTTGLPRAAKNAALMRTKDRIAAAAAGAAADAVGADLADGIAASRLTKMRDMAHFMALPGADVADVAKMALLNQGIFARDLGPFLRGKGITQSMVAGTPSGQPVSIGTGVNARTVQPYQISRCTGDELAFALFEQLLERKGFTDWRPDGIVLSKGVNDPSDKMSDEYLEARDGQLYNMRIQGPAITSSWTGDPALEVMPLDKVFVVIVADVWCGDNTVLGPLLGGRLQTFVQKVAPEDGTSGRPPTDAEIRAYMRDRDTVFEAEQLKEGANTDQAGVLGAGDDMAADAAGGRRPAWGRRPAGTDNLGTIAAAGSPYPSVPADLANTKAQVQTAAGDAAAAAAGAAAGQAAYDAAITGGASAADATLAGTAAENAAIGAFDRNPARTAAGLQWDAVLAELEGLWDAEAAYRNERYALKQQAEAFKTKQEEAYGTGEVTRLVNFRVKLATSSQMINYSNIRFDANGNQVLAPHTDKDQFRRVQNQSRMGLRLSSFGGEYIVGGWCIGNVLDTSASRAAFPSAGTTIGVRTAPNSMALNVNVNVEWWDADRMWRSYMNVEGTITPRYVKTVVPGKDGLPQLSKVNLPPLTAVALGAGVADIANKTDATAKNVYDNAAAAAGMSGEAMAKGWAARVAHIKAATLSAAVAIPPWP